MTMAAVAVAGLLVMAMLLMMIVAVIMMMSMVWMSCSAPPASFRPAQSAVKWECFRSGGLDRDIGPSVGR
jgi:hypothetical protein